MRTRRAASVSACAAELIECERIGGAGSKKWSRGELNPRPLECDSSALPTELRPHTERAGRRNGRRQVVLRGIPRIPTTSRAVKPFDLRNRRAARPSPSRPSRARAPYRRVPGPTRPWTFLPPRDDPGASQPVPPCRHPVPWKDGGKRRRSSTSSAKRFARNRSVARGGSSFGTRRAASTDDAPRIPTTSTTTSVRMRMGSARGVPRALTRTRFGRNA
jgi:hypothetical protein